MWIFVLRASSFHLKPFLYPELVFSECIKVSFFFFSCLGSWLLHTRFLQLQ